MDTVDEIDKGRDCAPAPGRSAFQADGFLLELSLDWIVLRASENIHHLLGKSHVTLIDEPLGRFVHSQALHDLRNLFSRLSGTTGIGRAYAVRLTDDNELVDIAFQLSDGRVLLEAVPSPGNFGEYFGTVAGLMAGLSQATGRTLLEGGARRMRALTGYDRVTLTCGDQSAQSSRGEFAGDDRPDDPPVLLTDSELEGVQLFPRETDESSIHEALMRGPTEADRQKLRQAGIRAMLRVPFEAGETACEFRCESRTPRAASFELHAATELFAQMFALRLELDRAGSPGHQPAK